MDGPVVLGLLVLAFGGFGVATGVLQWRGRLDRGRDPDALTSRVYLLTPTSLAFMLVGLGFVVAGAAPEDRAGAAWGVVVGLFVIALLSGLSGLALWLVQPRRLRPAWQRRQLEDLAARRARPRGAGAYGLDVVKLREPVRDRRRFTSEDEAVGAARAILADDPDIEHVLVVDRRVGAGVRVVER
jgi:hypothetical protein